MSEELKKEGVEVIRLGEGAEGAFVKLGDSLRTLDVLERRKFLIEFVDIWPDKDSALYTDALHSVEMGVLYLNYTGEQLVTECIAKARKSLKKILDIKDPAKRGEYVSFGLIGTYQRIQFADRLDLNLQPQQQRKAVGSLPTKKNCCNTCRLSMPVLPLFPFYTCNKNSP